MTATAIEQEILKACKLKPKRKKEDDQKYMMRILQGLEKLSDEDFFNKLSEEAQAWADKAVDAVGNAKEIPSFASSANGAAPDEEDEEEEEPDDEDESDDEESEDEEDDDLEEEEDEDESEEDEDPDEEEDEDEEPDEDEDEPEDEDEDMQTAETETTTRSKRRGSKKTSKKTKRKASARKANGKQAVDKKKKTKKAKGEAKTGGKRGRTSPRGGKKLTIVERKPKIKEGSKRAEMFAIAKKAKTVDDYLKGGGTSKFLDAMLEKGWVKLG